MTFTLLFSFFSSNLKNWPIKKFCIFCSEKPRWSVHGLWPTRLGEIAPNFCNDRNVTMCSVCSSQTLKLCRHFVLCRKCVVLCQKRTVGRNFCSNHERPSINYSNCPSFWMRNVPNAYLKIVVQIWLRIYRLLILLLITRELNFLQNISFNVKRLI